MLGPFTCRYDVLSSTNDSLLSISRRGLYGVQQAPVGKRWVDKVCYALVK